MLKCAPSRDLVADAVPQRIRRASEEAQSNLAVVFGVRSLADKGDLLNPATRQL